MDEFFARNTEWEPEYQGEERLKFDSLELESILDWECTSCRPEVGWAKFILVERDITSGEVFIRSECGHCGNDFEHDATTGDQTNA